MTNIQTAPPCNLRSATQSLIRACSDPAFDASYKWDVLLHHWSAAEIISQIGSPDFDPDEVGMARDDLAAALMAMPAPDAAAERWKLDYGRQAGLCNPSNAGEV